MELMGLNVLQIHLQKYIGACPIIGDLVNPE